MFLNKYNRRSQTNFVDALNDLRTSFDPYPKEEFLFPVPAYVDELISALEALYQYDDITVGYLRGAIVEQLTLQLVSQRCLANECMSNHLFLDAYGREVTGQLDVVALSHNGFFAEGYECKIHAIGTYGLMSKDCDNLRALVRTAHNEGYNVNVGVISFDNDRLIQKRLKHFNAPSYILAYGLESMIDLKSIPEYIGPANDV